MDRDAVRGGEGDGERLHERLRGILGVGGILVKVKMMSPNSYQGTLDVLQTLIDTYSMNFIPDI